LYYFIYGEKIMDEKDVTEALKKLLKGEEESYISLMKSMDDFNKRIRASTKDNGLLHNIVKQQKASYTDTAHVMEDYRKAVEQSKKAEDESKKKDQIAAAEKAKDAAMNAVRDQNILAAKQNFVVGTVTVTQQLVTGVASATTDLVKSMQTNTGGVGVATNALKYGVDAAAGAASTLGSALGGVGEMLQTFGKKGRIAGLVLEGAGKLVGGASKIASETAKAGIEILSREIEKAMETFASAATAGAIFVNGVKGLQDAAHDAGLSIVTMSNIIKNNSETLYYSGLNLGVATKKISGVFTVGGENFKRSLFNLGYSFEEQGALIAETMKYLSIAGRDLRSLDNNTIRLETEKYAINLKTISAITGDDAKKRMEDSRRAAANSLVQSKLAQMDKATREQFIADLAVVPDELKTAVLQQRLLGTVVDKNAAILMGVVPEMSNIVRGFSDNLGQGSVAMGRMRESFATAYRTAQEAGKLDVFGLAGLVGVAGTASDLEQYLQKLTLVTQQGVKFVGATSEIASTLAAMKDTVDPLTTDLGKLKIQAELLTTTLEAAAKDQLPGFSNLLGQVNEVMIKFVKEAGEYISSLTGKTTVSGGGSASITDKIVSDLTSPGTVGTIAGGTLGGVTGGRIAGAIAGRAAGAAAGAAVGSAVPLVGTIVGGLLGGFLGNEASKYIENKIKKQKQVPDATEIGDSEPAESLPGAANGNILQGSKSGYLAMLHGTEAVIPLPDGRSVPVNLTLPKFINYALPTNTERLMFTRDLKMDNLSAEVKRIKDSMEEIVNMPPTLTIPPEFKTAMELSNAALKEALYEQTVLIRDYNDKMTRLLSVASDTKNINQQLLNAAY
jgi:hypothetical protein